MRLTDEMIFEDNKRFKRKDMLAEFNYCGKEVPKRQSITNDDIRFYAWLCRSAFALLKEQQEIVRCRDCVYWQDNNDGYPHPDCKWGHDETPDPEDFCSAGERKET